MPEGVSLTSQWHSSKHVSNPALSPLPPGIAAATMFMPETENQLSDTQLKVAFDGDAVLFSDESEVIVKTQGLDTFFEHEKEFENKPLAQVTDWCYCRPKNYRETLHTLYVQNKPHIWLNIKVFQLYISPLQTFRKTFSASDVTLVNKGSKLQVWKSLSLQCPNRPL